MFIKTLFSLTCLILSVQGQISLESRLRTCTDSPLRDADGTQIQTGACSATPQGEIPTVDRMTSVLIIAPRNGEVFTPNTPITVKFKYRNLDTGNFADPQIKYNFFSQTLNANGVIRGHSHVTVQKIDPLLVQVPDAKVNDFFKGLNLEADANGVLTETINRSPTQPGLLAGNYRICSMSSSFSHQPVVMPVANRGPQDDCVRIQVVNNACPRTITVRAGDTFNGIAQREGVSAAALAGANNIINPDLILVGQQLSIVKPCTAQLNSGEFSESSEGSSVSTGVFVGVLIASIFVVGLVTFFAARLYYVKKSNFTDLDSSAPKI